MASTYIATTAFASTPLNATASRVQLQLFNGGTNVLRVYRVFVFNNQTAAATGVLSLLQLCRITAAATTNVAITPVAYDSTALALSSVTCGSVAGATPTVTPTDIIRRFVYSTDEPATAANKVDNLYAYPVFGTVFDATGDSNIEPIVLRQNQGLICFNHLIAAAAGIFDVAFEFTNAAS